MTRNLFVMGMAAAMVMLSGLSAQAAEPKRMLSEKDWEAFRVDGDKGRTCFISSLPTKSKGKYDPNNVVKSASSSRTVRARLSATSSSSPPATSTRNIPM